MEKLTFEDIKKAAAYLQVEPCALKAVVEVESGGSGFLPDGRVKILFEGHVFWRELAKRDLNPELLAREHPGIIHPKWDKSKYKGGAAEWDRLETAISIHREAALCSASYGLFQIMGFNYRLCNSATVEDFVETQRMGESAQLGGFCCFMKSQGLPLFLLGHDWAGFARRYNGPGYAANGYDAKLRAAYGRCARGASA